MNQTQAQTKSTFAFKWSNKKDSYESEEVKQKVYKWLLERYFNDSKEELNQFFDLHKGQTMLDAGCGNGHSAAMIFGKLLNQISYTGVDIADKAIEQAQLRFKENQIKGEFIANNIQTMDLDRKFDIIFSEGVIHHTSKPFETFENLRNHLKPGGLFMFYVYKKKAPIREFVDDYIRHQLQEMPNEEAWEKLIPFTKLGVKLGELNQEIEIEEDIELLEIPKGTYNLQRFFYWFIFKAYYDPNYPLEAMNHINFDWYSPLNCFRFHPDEIETWLKENDFDIEKFKVEESGITAIARKRQ